MLQILTDFAQARTDASRKVFAGEGRSLPSAYTRRASPVKPLHLIPLGLSLILFSVATLSAETLETANPFLPPGYGVKKPEPPTPMVQTNGPISRELEFRGVVKLDENYQFSVFNKSEQKSYWISENQAEGGISVRSYDADSRTITVNMNGRSELLTLMSASDAPLPVVSSVTQPANSNATKPKLPPGIENASNSNASSGENRRRVIPRRRVILPKK